MASRPESQRKRPRALPGSAPSSPSAGGTPSPAPPTAVHTPRGARGRERARGQSWSLRDVSARQAPRSTLSFLIFPISLHPHQETRWPTQTMRDKQGGAVPGTQQMLKFSVNCE